MFDSFSHDRRDARTTSEKLAHVGHEKKPYDKSADDEFWADYLDKLEKQRKLREQMNFRKELRRLQEMSRREQEETKIQITDVPGFSGGLPCVSSAPSFDRGMMPPAVPSRKSLHAFIPSSDHGVGCGDQEFSSGDHFRFLSSHTAVTAIPGAPPCLPLMPPIAARNPRWVLPKQRQPNSAVPNVCQAFGNGHRVKYHRHPRSVPKRLLYRPKSTLIKIKTVDSDASAKNMQ
ncbi:unnamed protein product [Soboliphyme baturini]|uniref:BUB1 N-terminal domain-containing protein n=1 Tax=Soboliphyme baturini TaxID=241478 RepID=A0A183IN49_9BILA|nr:unnamed protein product [Soboliphyme baturini]